MERPTPPLRLEKNETRRHFRPWQRGAKPVGADEAAVDDAKPEAAHRYVESRTLATDRRRPGGVAAGDDPVRSRVGAESVPQGGCNALLGGRIERLGSEEREAACRVSQYRSGEQCVASERLLDRIRQGGEAVVETHDRHYVTSISERSASACSRQRAIGLERTSAPRAYRIPVSHSTMSERECREAMRENARARRPAWG